MALFQLSFYAPSLRRTVPLTVVLPTDKQLPGKPGYQDAAPYKTLYLLHGVFGCSLGATHAVNLYFRFPDHFGRLMALSGIYRRLYEAQFDAVG